MIKMLLGAVIVVVLVGFGVFSTSDIEKAGIAAVSFVKDDIKPIINSAASKLAESTKSND
ncbi:uncharacterized protein METZ01_LOCUS176716 [marine metagenome]|uniref:Uncharacterized protein n=1 Tax=marine metagenome TaxID=408172 RepID=A0A382CDE6_9ZZZZ